jgi:XTP/dITP diphosphohydrolase
VIRFKPGMQLVVASHNRGKLKEIEALLAPYGLKTLGAAALGIAEPEETGTSFEENAQLKAEAAMRASGLPALADDSGLCVAALQGAPGIYSARWAGPRQDFAFAMKRVEDEMRKTGNPDTRAYFVCALALAAPGAQTEIFQGKIYGALTFPPRGDKGFGYDPLFMPEGYRVTFSEMDPLAKHAISHRARAFETFAKSALAPGTEQ